MSATQQDGHKPDRGQVTPHFARAVRFSRRGFLASSLASANAYAVLAGGATWIVGAGKAWAIEYSALEPELAETLLKMTRALYPHERLGDVYYAAVVKELDAEASGFQDKSRLELLRSGKIELDAAAGGEFATATPEDQEKALNELAGSDFFNAVRSKTVVALYNQPDVWEAFGYEGPSYEIGGYLFNGFNDLDWLPDPPAEASPPVEM